MQVSGAHVLESGTGRLQVTVTRVIADSDVRKLRDRFEFFNALERGDLVRNVLNQDVSAGESSNLGNRRIGVLECERRELLFWVAEVQDRVGNGDMVGKFERPLDFVQRGFTMPPFRLHNGYP